MPALSYTLPPHQQCSNTVTADYRKYNFKIHTFSKQEHLQEQSQEEKQIIILQQFEVTGAHSYRNIKQSNYYLDEHKSSH
jgi:hypothetical protein